MAQYDLHHRAAAVVRDAGGVLVGRTRLQKVAYLTQIAGFAADFPFEYRHYGPFSEPLAEAMEIATGLRLVREEERPTGWGGWYSVYEVVSSSAVEVPADADRARFVSEAAKINAVDLELAATAAFLYAEKGIGRNGSGDPWAETARLKPEKATRERLHAAKAAYRQLRALDTPVPLPPIA